MSEAITLDSLKLSPEILDLSKRLEKAFKIGDGAVINVEKTLFNELLPDGLTIDDVNRVQKHTENLTAASLLAFGHTAAPYFKKHKDVKSVELNFPQARNNLSMSMERVRTYPGRGEGAEEIVKYGQVSLEYTTHGAVNSRGAVKKIRGYMNDYCTAACKA